MSFKKGDKVKLIKTLQDSHRPSNKIVKGTIGIVATSIRNFRCSWVYFKKDVKTYVADKHLILVTDPTLKIGDKT